MLISPSAHGMCCMLKLCDEYARDFNVIFNASKSKCTVNRPRGFALGYCVGDVHFSVRGHDREIVDNCPHLGHIISNDGNAKLDIAHRCCQFIGQFNHVLCWFGKLDSSRSSKTKLLKSHCSDRLLWLWTVGFSQSGNSVTVHIMASCTEQYLEFKLFVFEPGPLRALLRH